MSQLVGHTLLAKLEPSENEKITVNFLSGTTGLKQQHPWHLTSLAYQKATSLRQNHQKQPEQGCPTELFTRMKMFYFRVPTYEIASMCGSHCAHLAIGLLKNGYCDYATKF